MRKKLKIFRYEASCNSFEDCAKLLENLWNQHAVRYSISTQLKDAKSVSPNGALAIENHRPSISSLSKQLKTLKDSEDQMVLDEIKSIQLELNHLLDQVDVSGNILQRVFGIGK